MGIKPSTQQMRVDGAQPTPYGLNTENANANSNRNYGTTEEDSRHKDVKVRYNQRGHVYRDEYHKQKGGQTEGMQLCKTFAISQSEMNDLLYQRHLLVKKAPRYIRRIKHSLRS